MNTAVINTAVMNTAVMNTAVMNTAVINPAATLDNDRPRNARRLNSRLQLVDIALTPSRTKSINVWRTVKWDITVLSWTATTAHRPRPPTEPWTRRSSPSS